jgi:hypothetical protein
MNPSENLIEFQKLVKHIANKFEHSTYIFKLAQMVRDDIITEISKTNLYISPLELNLYIKSSELIDKSITLFEDNKIKYLIEYLKLFKLNKKQSTEKFVKLQHKINLI